MSYKICFLVLYMEKNNKTSCLDCRSKRVVTAKSSCYISLFLPSVPRFLRKYIYYLQNTLNYCFCRILLKKQGTGYLTKISKATVQLLAKTSYTISGNTEKTLDSFKVSTTQYNGLIYSSTATPWSWWLAKQKSCIATS